MRSALNAIAAKSRFTIDSNVLVYAVDPSSGSKHRIAMQIMRQAPRVECLLTLQSISEFYWTATRKRIALADAAAAQARDWLDLFPFLPASVTAVRDALKVSLARRASYWDALLVATAAEAGCGVVLAEDMADGTVLNGVHIHDPFAAGEDLTDLTRELLHL